MQQSARTFRPFVISPQPSTHNREPSISNTGSNFIAGSSEAENAPISTPIQFVIFCFFWCHHCLTGNWSAGGLKGKWDELFQKQSNQSNHDIVDGWMDAQCTLWVMDCTLEFLKLQSNWYFCEKQIFLKSFLLTDEGGWGRRVRMAEEDEDVVLAGNILGIVVDRNWHWCWQIFSVFDW